MTAPPTAGFDHREFQARTEAAQEKMEQAGLAAMLLTTDPDIRYYTGFLTRFWESPTRPWYLVIPAKGKPIAVIPSIGAHLMHQTWLTDIRTWDAPDYTDDGIGLLTRTLCEVTPHSAAIGIPDAMESHLRMPRRDLQRLEHELTPRKLVSDAQITRALRMIKSPAEQQKIRAAARVADRAFDRVSEIAAPGDALSKVFRHVQMLCLEEGADWVAYLAGAAGQNGYADVISPATDAPLRQGDVLMLDTGVVRDGYYCDFDRNFSIGPANATVTAAHHRLIDATWSAFELIKPGVRMSDLFEQMAAVTHPGTSDAVTGRLGHGLGLQLTEWPSILPVDHTPLQPGMVLTLEPFVSLDNGRIMVHEENVVVQDAGAEWLSTPQGRDIRVV
ncbi:MAG: M24 family metallopeptidase [Tateyamaria sp.]